MFDYVNKMWYNIDVNEKSDFYFKNRFVRFGKGTI